LIIKQGERIISLEDLTLDVEQHIEINGKPDKVFATMLEHLENANTRPMASQ